MFSTETKISAKPKKRPKPKNVLLLVEKVVGSAHFFGGNVVASLSVPSFYDNFDTEKGELNNPDLITELKAALSALDG